jgi:SAM-dependent methyltransferase
MTTVYEYDGDLFPEYLKHGNAMQFFAPFAKQFCSGRGVDVGCGKWPFPGAEPIDVKDGRDAMDLPIRDLDYVVSSHCLEHLSNPVAALEHWKNSLKPCGVLALYLPHPDMTYWRPSRCRKHLHSWQPEDMAAILRDIGFVDVLHTTGHDLAWSFAVVGWNGRASTDQGEHGNV